jgi:hypothetical protein
MSVPAESARPQPRLLPFPRHPLPRPRPRPRLRGRAVVLHVFAFAGPRLRRVEAELRLAERRKEVAE